MIAGEGWLWVGIGATLAGGWTSTVFHSVRDISRARIAELAAADDERVRARLHRIMDDSSAHAAAVGLPRIVFSFLSAVAFVFYATHLRGKTSPEWQDIAIGIVIASAMTWLFGLAIPVSIAKHAGENVVYTHARMIRLVRIVTRPLATMTRFFDEVVRRLAGKPLDSSSSLQDELLSVVEEATHGGQFDALERDMIAAVVRFKDKTVMQIMTPRTEMEAMPVTKSLGEVTATIRRTRHSRIPVFENNPDNIVGIFYVKDLMRWLAGDAARSGKTFDFRSILRPAIFVPESKTIRELLQELLDKKVHIAMVADEFGGTAGLVTIEDLLEEIVGEIRDEYEPPEEDVPEVSLSRDRVSAEVDARAYIETANDALAAAGLEIPESEDYDTVGGFITVNLGRIPTAGERVTLGPMLVTVLEAEPTRVTRVKLEPVSDEKDDASIARELKGEGVS